MDNVDDRLKKLRDAGMTLVVLTDDARKRLESLTEAEVEALASAARKLSDSGGLKLTYTGNFQYTGLEEW